MPLQKNELAYGYFAERERKVKRQPKKRGPKAVPRVRITVNLPSALIEFVATLPGRSVSSRICGALESLRESRGR